MTIKEVEELIRFVAKANVSEVEFETKDVKLVIKTNKAAERTVEVQMQPQAVSQPAPAKQVAVPAQDAPAPKPQPKADSDAGYITIKSPMIGTFYRSPGPDKPPFVNVGDKIEKGKVICVIEAMKLFNEIEAEISGTVVKVLLNDASPAEYDQPLFLIDPS
jgi:acetyl-CoA carboxylase biotin carboxyl carrier protein